MTAVSSWTGELLCAEGGQEYSLFELGLNVLVRAGEDGDDDIDEVKDCSLL